MKLHLKPLSDLNLGLSCKRAMVQDLFHSPASSLKDLNLALCIVSWCLQWSVSHFRNCYQLSETFFLYI